MNRNRTIIKGAFILTVTGFATRIIGFFYRIFLSQTFGEEGVGIYQLAFPVFALGFSLTAAGIETAISRNVASKTSLGRSSDARITLYVGCGLSIFASFLVMLIVQENAGFIASSLLQEPRCEELLIILSYAFPFASLHSCICGYYLALKQTKVPAISQIIEQIVRVASVFLLYYLTAGHFQVPNIIVAMAGLFFGEFASSVFCFYVFRKQSRFDGPAEKTLPVCFAALKELLSHSVPLTCNRVLLNILQSIESVSIPLQLQVFGFSISQSLSIYGVLTGMALPCILFPSAITNSIASMMLPTIAEIQATDNTKVMFRLIKKVVFCCFSLGLLCCIGLIVFGSFIGEFLFHSEMAGEFIITLAWMCPFLYTNGNLISTINGLGLTLQSFLFNTLGLAIRIASVFYLIPLLGIRGYLIGLLISQLAIFLLCCGFLYIYLHIYLQKRFSRIA